MPLGFFHRQRLQGRQTFGIRLAGLLDLPEKDCSAMIREMESDPLFQKLAYPEGKDRRAVRYRPFRQTSLSSGFFELKEDLVSGAPAQSSELDVYLAGKEKIVRLAKTIGEEKFGKLFLYAEDDLTIEQISEECGLSAHQVREILDLVNMAAVYGEFSASVQAPSSIGIPYSLIGSIVGGSLGGYDIHFASPQWARGVYQIDFNRIEKMKREKFFSKEEVGRLPSLLKDMELINFRKATIFRIMTAIVRRQKAYLDARGASALSRFLQKELAAELGLNPSSVSRAVSGKVVETPWGEKKFLKEFFLSGDAGESIRENIAGIIRAERAMLEEGALDHAYADKEISRKLLRDYGQRVAPTTVSKYRRQLAIPNSFRRKP